MHMHQALQVTTLRLTMAIVAPRTAQALLVYDAAARLRACEAARPLHVSLLRLVATAAPRLPAATAMRLFSALAPALRAAPDAATPAAATATPDAAAAAAAPLLCALELLAALAALPALQRQSLATPLVQVDCMVVQRADAHTLHLHAAKALPCTLPCTLPCMHAHGARAGGRRAVDRAPRGGAHLAPRRGDRAACSSAG